MYRMMDINFTLPKNQEKFCPLIKGPCKLTDCVACEITDENWSYDKIGLVCKIKTTWFCKALDNIIKVKIDEVK